MGSPGGFQFFPHAWLPGLGPLRLGCRSWHTADKEIPINSLRHGRVLGVNRPLDVAAKGVQRPSCRVWPSLPGMDCSSPNFALIADRTSVGLYIDRKGYTFIHRPPMHVRPAYLSAGQAILFILIEGKPCLPMLVPMGYLSTRQAITYIY